MFGRRWRAVSLGLVSALGGGRLLADPQGMSVAAGSASATAGRGGNLTLQVSNGAVLDWKSFNIAAGESTTFAQPSAASVVWNRINDPQPSRIFGQLSANGVVVLANSSGFYFGPGSVIRAASFVATTATSAPADLGGGGPWQFSGMPPMASIINYGQISVKSGGSAFLIAEKIENHGIMMAPDGTIGLYAGKQVILSDRPDGRGLSAQVTLPEGSVDNTGKLVADAGTIALHANVVNQNGLIQANSIRERDGVIELVASESVNLGPNSTLVARGDDAVVSGGGQVTVKSENAFSDATTSTIDVSGGAQGGNGGHVEVSAPRMGALNSRIDGTAQTGWTGGTLAIDPTDIILSRDGSDSAGTGVVNAGDPGDTLNLNVNSAFTGFSQILLQATRDISLASFTAWNLNASTGISAPGSQLTLQAGRNILFGDSSSLVAGAGWSVTLIAGADFKSPTSVVSGVGGIYFNGGPADVNGVAPNGNGALETAEGNIKLVAGAEVRVGGGYVRTDAGGNIDVTTLGGDVNAGTKTDGFQFSRIGYVISTAGLGGIATGAGGNVSISAGGDILSFLPTIGAYGAAPGDVTLHADGRILGNFLVRNGVGALQAGTDVGSGSSPVTLSLIAGSWNVSAARDLYLNEVRNPNGTFNSTRVTTGARIPYQFDYAPDASVSLTAGNSVQLLGSNLARTSGNQSMPPIYPPQLSVTAGPGGIVMGNDVILYPSAKGSLEMTTTGGGSLRSAAGGFYELVMSDSGSANYQNFDTDHAATPLHLGQAQAPVQLNISGDVDNFFLRVPMTASVTIGGSTLNFGFEGQNLAASDVTSVTIGGDFRSRLNRTFEPLTSAPDFAVLDPLISNNPDIASRLTYDPATGLLGFQGKMTTAERDFLLHPFVRTFDNNGNPIYDNSGNPVLAPAVFTTDAAAIQALYANSQDIPSSGSAYAGLQVGGPGKFNVSARNMDLGITAGIRSVGPGLNPAVAQISTAGADVSVTLADNLSLTSSQIASFSGGSIHVTTGGTLDVGSQVQYTSDDTPKGIYTVNAGNVSVTAVGDINVNGSRIAAYDGGNVSVDSTGGSVNAGAGGLGFVVINRVGVDPVTGAVTHESVTIPGSGILATALPNSPAHVGDIQVTAAKDILANSGGIIQLPFNGSDPALGSINLTAQGIIDASNSGVIGGNVSLTAGKDIIGLVVARANINIVSQQSVSVTVLAQGGVSISAGGTVSGSIVGGTAVNVSGDSISANLISQSVKTSGDASSASVGVPQVAAASGTSKNEQPKETVAEATAQIAQASDDDDKKKKRGPVLAKSTGRVTVILHN